MATDCDVDVFTSFALRGSSSYALIDWALASVALFNPVGVGAGFACSLDEMSMKMTGRPSPNLG